MKEIKLKSIDKDKTAKNAKEYENITKQKQNVEKSGDKVLYHQRTEYGNGVVKNKLIGILKDGKTIFDVGIKK